MKFLKRNVKPKEDWRSKIHSADALRKMLQAERMRSDRSGIKFCLVVFALDGKKGELIDQLVTHIKGRLRATDSAGLVGENDIGVILWDTLEPGAKSYVKQIRLQAAAECILSATLYIYPQVADESDSHKTSASREPGAHLKPDG